MKAASVSVSVTAVVYVASLTSLFHFGVAQLQGLDINNVDPTPFLQNPVFVRRQLSCVSGTGPCDFIGRYLGRAVVEVLSRNCRSCTPQQAATANTVLNFIRNNYPTEYAQIYNRYSRPQGQAG